MAYLPNQVTIHQEDEASLWKEEADGARSVLLGDQEHVTVENLQ